MIAELKFSIEEESWQEEWKALDADLVTKVVMALEVTGFEAVAFLRSLTATLRPPARAGEGSRRAHPGGWADITGNLANAYFFQVKLDGWFAVWSLPGPKGTVKNPVAAGPVQVQRTNVRTDELPHAFQLILANDFEYAVFLEDRDGFYVLAGITDDGAPLDRALSVAAQKLGFEVR